jgi:hypothetical protein
VGKVLSSLEDVTEYLSGLEQNTAANPYTVILTGLTLTDLADTSGPLEKLLVACGGKYMNVNLSACDIESIPDGSFNSASYRDGLVAVTLPKTLKSIGKAAFRMYPMLKSVEFNDGLETIGDSAFALTSLESVVLPASLNSLGYGAFAASIANNALVQPSLKSIDLSKTQITTLMDAMFYEQVKLTTVKLPPTLTTIKDAAFYKCTTLKAIELPNSVTEIGDSFIECTELAAINIPSSLEKIGNRTFVGCLSLNGRFVFPSSFKALGDGNLSTGAFFRSDIKELDLSQTQIETIYTGTFMESHLQSIKLPPTLKKIVSAAFRDCGSLATVELPSTMETVEGSAFIWCDKVTFTVNGSGGAFSTAANGKLLVKGTTVVAGNGAAGALVIPEGITAIGPGAFVSNKLHNTVTSVTFPVSLTTIEPAAFYDVESLERIEFLGNVPEFKQSHPEMGVFGYNVKLETVIFRGNPGPADASVFANTHANLKIQVPADKVPAYKTAMPAYEAKIVAIDG